VIDTIIEMFSYSFIRRAVIIGLLVSLSSSLLGVSLVLKRYAMIGDGLSHIGFGALSVAVVLNITPLALSIPTVIIAAFFLLKLNNTSKIKSDWAIAIISSTALSIGIFVTSLSNGLSVDISQFMFGSILSITDEDFGFSIITSVVVIILFLMCYNYIFATTFDEVFLKAKKVNVNLINNLIAIATAVTIVIGMRIMGTMLISSLIVFPPISAMRVTNGFKGTVLLSSIISLFCFLVGIFISYTLDTPVGATVVLINFIIFILMSFISFIKYNFIKSN